MSLQKEGLLIKIANKVHEIVALFRQIARKDTTEVGYKALPIYWGLLRKEEDSSRWHPTQLSPVCYKHRLIDRPLTHTTWGPKEKAVPLQGIFARIYATIGCLPSKLPHLLMPGSDKRGLTQARSTHGTHGLTGHHAKRMAGTIAGWDEKKTHGRTFTLLSYYTVQQEGMQGPATLVAD